MEQITSFSGKWFTLSNFARTPIKLPSDGLVYPTAEHLFQALKSTSDSQSNWIRLASSPRQAKQRGRSVKLRSDWEDIKIDVMKEVLELKFADEVNWKVLDSTANAFLIEGNTWGDRYWGQCPVGDGRNMLGKLLMERRELNRNAKNGEEEVSTK